MPVASCVNFQVSFRDLARIFFALFSELHKLLAMIYDAVKEFSVHPLFYARQCRSVVITVSP
jgi:hypothetical protein